MIMRTIFVSVNTVHKFLWHERILVNYGYDQHMSKANLHLPGRNKEFMFTIEEAWDQGCIPKNQIFNISSGM